MNEAQHAYITSSYNSLVSKSEKLNIYKTSTRCAYKRIIIFQLFLFHLDEILPNAAGQVANGSATGCSSIMVNEQGDHEEILGHTEDAHSDYLNNFYFVSAHIINEKPEGKWQVTEERFTSLCYAGHLPGYTMNYNHHGLVFSINTLSAKRLNSGKIRKLYLLILLKKTGK